MTYHLLHEMSQDHFSDLEIKSLIQPEWYFMSYSPVYHFRKHRRTTVSLGVRDMMIINWHSLGSTDRTWTGFYPHWAIWRAHLLGIFLREKIRTPPPGINYVIHMGFILMCGDCGLPPNPRHRHPEKKTWLQYVSDPNCQQPMAGQFLILTGCG